MKHLFLALAALFFTVTAFSQGHDQFRLIDFEIAPEGGDMVDYKSVAMHVSNEHPMGKTLVVTPPDGMENFFYQTGVSAAGTDLTGAFVFFEAFDDTLAATIGGHHWREKSIKQAQLGNDEWLFRSASITFFGKKHGAFWTGTLKTSLPADTEKETQRAVQLFQLLPDQPTTALPECDLSSMSGQSKAIALAACRAAQNGYSVHWLANSSGFQAKKDGQTIEYQP